MKSSPLMHDLDLPEIMISKHEIIDTQRISDKTMQKREIMWYSSENHVLKKNFSLPFLFASRTPAAWISKTFQKNEA